MWKRSVVLFVALALSAAALVYLGLTHPGHADAGEDAAIAAEFRRVATALLASPEASQRASGLLLIETMAEPWFDNEPILSPDELLDQLHALIEQADDRLTRALLAQFCAMTDLQTECRQRGLDDAIAGQDGGELLSRLYLTEPGDSERVRALLIAAERIDEVSTDHALIVTRAFEQLGAAEAAEPTAVGSLLPLLPPPPLQTLADLCREPAALDPALDQACDRLLTDMISGPHSLGLVMIGAGLIAQRAEAAGDADAMARYQAWRSASFDWLRCLGEATTDTWQTAEPAQLRDALELWQRHGEAHAQAYMASLSGVDCGHPEPAPGH